MSLPFNVNQFLGVFEVYNYTIWPMQVLAYLFGIAAIYLVIKQTKNSNRIINSILSFMWVWIGVAYHILHFSTINKAAYLFGVLFVIQGVLFFWFGVVKPAIKFQLKFDSYSVTGWLFVLYALVIYPIAGYIFGHAYPQSPIFGVTPCPTTIFTFGLLLMTERLPKQIPAIPFIWSIIGFFAAISLGIREDVGLLVAGVTSTSMIIFRSSMNNKVIIKGANAIDE